VKSTEQERALGCAVSAARAAGALMRRNLSAKKTVNSVTRHDIKLELDVRCQRLIERKLRKAFPEIALLGEEGESVTASDQYRWVVDPIDGTVNFAYGIPHCCVSIALQSRRPRSAAYQTLLGTVYDPFQDEIWTAIRGGPARLNGRRIRVSRRRELAECIVSAGFSKDRVTLERGLPKFIWLLRRVRKVRMMGAAALGLCYVATGRFDAYLEGAVSLWDVAAGGLIIECAGGRFWTEPISGRCRVRMVASNGSIHSQLPVLR
jgi:myo-inositol-1(or 4)-monophosphatase